MAKLAGWSKRIELKIEDYAGDIGASVTWFPVTIFLKNANGDSTKVFLEVGANSRKIAITKSDGTTELKGEIEQWSYDAGTPANSVAVIHTSADGWTINANTSIYLYYDNDHADNANVNIINTTPGAAVWDGNFKMVHHMVDDNGNVDDSTSNNNDGTKLGVGEPNEVAGKVGQAQHFDGTDDYISHSAIKPAYFTVSAWVNKDSDKNQIIICSRNANAHYGYMIRYSADGKLSARLGGAATGGAYAVEGATEVAIGEWHLIALTLDSSGNLKLWLDGVQEGDTTVGASAIYDTTMYPYIGKSTQTSYGDPIDSIIDEVHISNIDRGVAWIKGSYNSGYDSLFTYGSEEIELRATIAITTSITSSLSRGITEFLTATSSITTSITSSLSKGITVALTATSAITSSLTASLSRGITEAATATIAITSSITSTLSRGITQALTSTINITTSLLGRLLYDWWEEIKPTIDWIEGEKGTINWDEETKSEINYDEEEK